ncbi:MAG: zinc-binding dehydrogenase [Pyrinomonadaceae bacterium]
MLESNEDLSRKFASVIRKLSTHDKYFKVVFDELKRLTQQYSLSEAAEAVRYVEEGHARGKVVIDCRSAREAGVSIEPGVERGFASATLGSRTQ